MKTCKNCKSPFTKVELSSIIRGYAITDVFRFLILLGPMLSLFYACTNIHPMYPHVVVGGAKHGDSNVDYVLYNANRSELSNTEHSMLNNIKQTCGPQYADNLPSIWAEGRPTLFKALYLQGIAMVLPATSSICFLMFQKKDVITSVLAVIHFSFELISITLSLFGAYFASDGRLCFLGHFSKHLNVPILLWTINIIFAVVYKVGMLYCLELYIEQYCKSKSLVYRLPTPPEELKSYLQELKSLGVKPRTRFELPPDPSKDMDWEYVDATIKKILVDVRIQMAELHKDDPLVSDLLKSGKLAGQGRSDPRKRAGSTLSGTLGAGTGPSILKIAKMMASRNAEYKLLKQHQQNHQLNTRKSVYGGKDDVEIILPEPSFRFDPD